jgi:hypothetical protein
MRRRADAGVADDAPGPVRRFATGACMTADEICKVIGSGRYGVDGGPSGKPISKSTLFKHFRTELAGGRSMLKAKVAGRFYAALDNNEAGAIQMAMRNQFNWDAGRGGFEGVVPQIEGAGGGPLPVQVEFVVPTRREPEQAPTPGRIRGRRRCRRRPACAATSSACGRRMRGERPKFSNVTFKSGLGGAGNAHGSRVYGVPPLRPTWRQPSVGRLQLWGLRWLWRRRRRLLDEHLFCSLAGRALWQPAELLDEDRAQIRAGN